MTTPSYPQGDVALYWKERAEQALRELTAAQEFQAAVFPACCYLDRAIPVYGYPDNAARIRAAADLIITLRADLAAALERIQQLELLNTAECNHSQLMREQLAAREEELASVKAELERTQERAQSWRDRTREAEDVALEALASFKITQSLDDYQEGDWSHKAERIRVIRSSLPKEGS